MFYDYHVHSNFSTDSKATMDDMVQQAINIGLKEICFTDHADYDVYLEPFEPSYNKYFENIKFLQDKYKNKISIKKGMEFGLQKQIIDLCSNDINNNPFDFIICSVHAIDTLDLYLGHFFEGKTQKQAYEAYFNEIYTIVKNFKDYSILGHFDLIKRYGNYDKLLDDRLFSDIIESILKQVIYDGKGIEINTSCYRYNLPDLTPSRYILQMYKNLGGEIITTGSDAHRPNQLAYKFDYIYTVLKEIGFNYISTFDNMNPQFIKI
ncbi:MAG: histidinol-phosphatase HisJ family protein [Romboutsia sp.]